ncbi:MAG TPA: Dabb family protein, partial [Planctomycetota bacterium]|nr:Dabb family protein [Planctomycetota bacterium]
MKRTRFFLNSACLGIAALLLLLSAEPCHAQDKPVHHIVLFKFKETTSPSEIQAISKSFSELAGRVSGLRGFQWGRNDSPEGLDRGFTHAFIL